jgi:hypothetical protein
VYTIINPRKSLINEINLRDSRLAAADGQVFCSALTPLSFCITLLNGMMVVRNDDREDLSANTWVTVKLGTNAKSSTSYF